MEIIIFSALIIENQQTYKHAHTHVYKTEIRNESHGHKEEPIHYGGSLITGPAPSSRKIKKNGGEGDS